MGSPGRKPRPAPYTVYGMSASGNCYKVKLLLENLGRRYDWRETDITRGESRTPGFLAMNPNGRVPLLQIGSDTFLPESNAILCYLAEGTPLLPRDRLKRAQVLQWLFFEQYSHEPYVAVARYIRVFLPEAHERRAELTRLLDRGYQALAVMDQHLREHDWFVGGRYSIADIALYAYTHCAEDGGFTLERFPGILAWLRRVRAQPGFVHM